MKLSPKKFSVTVQVKPYVRRFIEMNYGFPADFSNDSETHRFFSDLLRKPDYTYDRRLKEVNCTYTSNVEVLISEHDFYHYGWELTKKNTVAFGIHFEKRAKLMMRNLIGVYHGLGLPLYISIGKFQERFKFEEDTWRFDSIKKDFYRNGQVEIVDFDNEIFRKIEKIILRNMSELGTITKQVIREYETVE